MERLKQFGRWILIILAFWIYTNLIIYISLNGEEIGMKIYNMTHDEEIVNEVK